MFNLDEYLLICLAEECAEIQQRVTKALRFGLFEFEPGQPYNNIQRLRDEINDLYGVLELTNEHDSDLILAKIDRKAVDAKKDKVLKYMEYSRDQGTLEEDKDS